MPRDTWNVTLDTSFGYTGEQTDLTGLQYLRARYYDPGAGRFLTRDSFAGYAVLPQSQNPYVYALNNPIRYTDPSGHCIDPVTGAACGFVIAAGANLIYQLYQNGGKWECVDWGQVLLWGGVGAVAGFGLGVLMTNPELALWAYTQVSAWIATTPAVSIGLNVAGTALGAYAVYDVTVNHDEQTAFILANLLMDNPTALYEWGASTLSKVQGLADGMLGGLGFGVPDEFLPLSIRMSELGKLDVEQTPSTSALSRETGVPISITGRWSDTISEAAWRANAVARMNELIQQGVPGEIALNQTAEEFGIFQHQVKISTVKNEVDAYIPSDLWDNLSGFQQKQISASLKEIFDVREVDWRQILIPEPGWPDPATTIPPGSITFDPFGNIIHEPFGK